MFSSKSGFFVTFATQKKDKMKIKLLLPVVVFATGGIISVSARTPDDGAAVLRLDMPTMFAMADENNTSIRSYELAEAAAAEAVKSARNDRLPSIDFSASVSFLGDVWIADRDFSNGTNGPMPHFGNNFAVEAAQVVYAGGAVSNNIALAELKLKSMQSEADANRQSVRFLLVGNLLELCKLDNRATVLRKNIEQTRRLLDDIRARQREGLAIRNDITRYELQLQRLELALTRSENSRAIVNGRLAVALGIDSRTRIEPDSELTGELPDMTAEAVWQDRAGDSPLLRQARFGVEQARVGVKLARAERIPSISLFAGDRLDGPVTVEVPPLNKNLNYWFAGVGLKFNIGSLYKSGRNIRRAKYASQRAEVLEQLAEENLRSDVREAYIRYNESFTVYEMQRKNLELAAENYDVVRNRFLNGLALITDMLDADNAKLSAELDVANARVEILFNRYRLKKIAGDL